MTQMVPPVSPDPPPSASPPLARSAARRQRPLLRWLLISGAGLVILLAGVGIGMAGSNNQSQLNAANAKVSARDATIGQLRGQVSRLQAQLTTAKAGLTKAQMQASHALSIATAKVKAQDAARQAQLNQEAATLKSRQAQLNAETGMVQANQISQDGVYVIGHDMKGGTWHTSGGGQCYEATLSGPDTVHDIISNNNFNGPDTVDMSGAYAFNISGGCTWVKIG